MVDSAILKTTTYLEELSNERFDHFPGLILQGLQVIHVGKGIVRCKLIITDRVLGVDGTFHTGAIAALMEMIGGAAIYSAGRSHVSVELSYSLYSTAKKQEEVKIEARVIGRKEDLNSAVIEIRREYDEELIATGRLWMVQVNRLINLKHNGVNQASKL